MSKVLVTGGAGFVGSNLVDKMIQLGHEVVIVDNLISGKEEYINKEAVFYKVDICSEEIKDIFQKEKPDYVFHLAAQIDVRKSVEDPVFDNEINVLGGLNILKNCHVQKVKKIIFASTGGAVYGDAEQIPTTEKFLPGPISPYGINKLSFEKYLNYYYQIYKQDYIALRFANIYGPRQFKGGEAGVIAIFTDNAVNDKESTLNGDGSQTRDFVYIKDVVDAFASAMTADYVGEINIGTGIETDLKKVIQAIELALDRKIKIKQGPAKEGEQMRSCLDYSLAEKVLDWKPMYSIEDGIKETIEWSIQS